MPARPKSIQALRKELEAKEKSLDKLQSQRDKAAAAVVSLDRQIAVLRGGARKLKPKRRKKRKARAKKAARRRGRKGQPLVAYIRNVLSKAPEGMRAKNVQKAVLKAGYKTASKDFYGIVAAALRDNTGFKRLKRGVYTLA